MLEKEKIRLQLEMVNHLLKYRFTWNEIEFALGFSKEQMDIAEKKLKEES